MFKAASARIDIHLKHDDANFLEAHPLNRHSVLSILGTDERAAASSQQAAGFHRAHHPRVRTYGRLLSFDVFLVDRNRSVLLSLPAEAFGRGVYYRKNCRLTSISRRYFVLIMNLIRQLEPTDDG